MNLEFIKIDDRAVLPSKKYATDACFDINAIWFEKKDFTVIAHTGLRCNIPVGYELQVRSRSGMAANGVFVVNAPGCCDAGYTGELMVILGSITGQAPYMPTGSKYEIKCANMEFKSGDRIAQICLVPVLSVTPVFVDDVVKSDRGDKGIGSTGVSADRLPQSDPSSILKSLDEIDAILEEADAEDRIDSVKDSGVRS